MPTFQLTLRDGVRPYADVEVTAEPDTPLSSLLAALPTPAGTPTGPGPDGGWFAGAVRLDPATTVGESPIVQGAVLSHAAPGPAPPPLALGGRRRPDGTVVFDRSFAPRRAVAPITQRIDRVDHADRGIWALVLTVALPVVAAVVLALVMRQPTFLMMALLGPVSGIGQYVLDRRQRRRREAELARRRAEVTAAIAAHVEGESEVRAATAPDPAHLLASASRRLPDVWPRNADQDDALVLRVGTADQPASITLDADPWPGMPELTLPAAPVTVDLAEVGVLAVVGPPDRTAGLVRWLVVQLATLRAPHDLRLVVLAADGAPHLAWTRWLPHLTGGADLPCAVGVTGASRTARVRELRDLVARRRSQASAARHRFDHVVVVLDGALALRELPGMREVLIDGPAVGVHAICVDTGSPNEAGAQCRFEPGGGLRVHRRRSDTPIVAVPDQVSLADAEAAARALCPLRDRITLAADTHAIPHPVRLLDVAGLPAEPREHDVLAAWRRAPGPVTRVPIGADAEGVVCVDLSAQGPHAMLGGAPGAGKSVLLQSFVTSLLLANSPDELNLVLVDFKGGGAFLPFRHVPHVVSLLLSTGETGADVFTAADARRVLASVRAEVARREALLAKGFGAEIDAYWTARRTDPSLAPLPRLVLVFDEFARVLEVDPGFLKELVNVAAKGRSLGMHLVLATQSLQGKLTPELKNNVSLRISLRQNEPADSVEILEVPDAARIPGRLRGRGLVLCTADEVRRARPFQSGYLGDPPPVAGAAPAAVRLLPWPAVGEVRPEPAAQEAGPSQLELTLAAVARAGEAFLTPRRPLLPPLPARLTLADTDDDLDETPTPPTTVPLGLVDDPVGQAQPLLALDLLGTDRLMICGGPQSGRTTAVHTLVAALTGRLRPDQVHLYLVEHVPSGLAVYERLPHCGAVIGPHEPDRLRRLVQWLAAELGRRRAVRLTDPGAPGPVPIVVIVDGWEVFDDRGNDPAFVETSLLTTMREVVSTGVLDRIHVVATGGQRTATGRLAELYQVRLVLPFATDDDRRLALAPGTVLPPRMPGRAVEAGTGRQVQLCLPGATAHHLIEDELHRPLPARGLPVPIAPLPRAVRLGALPAGAAGEVVLGLGGLHLEPQSVTLPDAAAPVLLISGPERSGRSTALLAVLEGLARQGVPVLAVAAARSPLAASGVPLVAGPAVDDADLRAAADRLGPRYVVLVDDVHQLSVKRGVEGFVERPSLLEEVAEDASGQRAVVIAGDGAALLTRLRPGLTPLAHRAIGSGHRLVLAPTRLQDARDHGLDLEVDQLFAGPAGRGYLASGRRVTLIQVATP